MSEIKRYDPMSFGIENAFLSEDPEGDAVKYDDYYYALAAKDAEIEKLKAALKPFAEVEFGDIYHDSDEISWPFFYARQYRAARKALKGDAS